ncbi:MAG: diguanylate cyclase [bacterium]|nr:diguanylate cyclase [bacterium]
MIKSDSKDLVNNKDIKIIVVDEEESICNLISKLLSRQGYLVKSFKTNEEALDEIRKNSCDIVISDIKMAGMDNIALIGKIKKICSDINIIVITEYPSLKTAIMAMKEGACDYISIPFNEEEIKLVVNKVVERVKKCSKTSKEENNLLIIDDLTGVYNQRYLELILEKGISRAKRYPQPLALLIVCINDLKEYIDKNGKLAGEFILKIIAKMFTDFTRECDMVARLKEDEFAIVLVETDKEEAYILAKRLLEVMKDVDFGKKNGFPEKVLTISIGIASYPRDADNEIDLLNKAITSLYFAKKEGSGIYLKNSI